MTTTNPNSAPISSAPKGRSKLFAVLLVAAAIFGAGRAEAANKVNSLTVGAQSAVVCTGSTTSTSYTITITWNNGQAASTNVSLSATPSGVTAISNPFATITFPATTATLTFNTASAVAQNTTFTVSESFSSNSNTGNYFVGPPTQPGAFTTSTATVCQGASNVAYTVGASVPSGVTYHWTYSGTGASFGTNDTTSTSNTVSYSASATSGTLSVTANDTCGASTARTLSITVNPLALQPGVFTTSSSTVCQGQNSVAYTVTASATPGVTYHWSYSGTGATFGTNDTSSTSNTVNFSLTATAGTLSVTANNTCGASTSRDLAISVNPFPAQPGVFTTSTTPVCQGSTGNPYTVTASATPGVTYHWSYSGTGATFGTNDTSSTSNTVDYSGTATSGTISVTANNTCGTSTARTAAITVNPVPNPPGAFTTSTASICAPASNVVYVVGASSTAAVTYHWTYSGTGATINTNDTTGADSTTVSFSAGATSGTLSVTARKAGCESTSQSVAITVNPSPAAPGAFSASTTTICAPASNVTYTVGQSVTSGVTYHWSYTGTGASFSDNDSSTAFTTNVSFTGAATSGTLSVVAQKAGCSSGAQSVGITVNPTPTPPGAFSASTSPVCQGQSSVTYTVGASSTAGVTYHWTYSGTGVSFSANDTAGALTTNVSFSGAATSGTLSVTARKAGCGSTPQTFAVTVNVPPSSTITATPTSVCSGSTGNQASVPDAGVGATYAWSITSGGTITSATNVNPISYTANATGPVSIHVTVTANGCSSTGALSVTVNALPALTAHLTGSNPICLGTAFKLDHNGSPTNISCSWTASPNGSGQAGFSGTLADASCSGPNVTPTVSGTYVYTLTATDTTTNCQRVSTDSKTVQDAITGTGIVSGSNAVCSGASGVAYSVSGYSNVPAGGYAWTVPAGATVATGQGTASITVNWGSTSGNVSVTPSDSCGSATPASLAVTVSAALGSTGTITGTASVCAGSSGVPYSIGTVTNATTYTWSYTGTNFTIHNQGTNSITIDFASNATGGNLTVTPSNVGCTGTASAPVVITVNTVTTANAGPDQPSVCGTSATLNGNAPAGGETGTWTVQAGTGTFSPDANTPGAIVNGLSAGLNTFRWTISNGSCSTHDDVDITSTSCTSKTFLSSSQNPSTHGESVTFYSSVTGSSGTPTGSVDFKDGAGTIATKPLVSGKASYSTSTLSIGTHPITAVYSGDGNYSASTSDVVNQVVNSDTVVCGSFGEPAPTHGVGSQPRAVAVGSFNSNTDGNLDLLVANTGDGNLTLLLGDGSGGFSPAAGSPFSAGTGPFSVAVGDFDGDGKLDFAAVSADGNVYVLLGDGTGAFSSAGPPLSPGGVPISIAAGDFDGDGKLDLVVSNSSGNANVFLGNGDGTFQAAVDYPAGSNPDSVKVADFNGDGVPDLVVANNSSDDTVSVLLGNGDGTFQSPAPYAAGSFPRSVAVGDFNGDGFPDLAVTDQLTTVNILLGVGDGTFGLASPFGGGTGPLAIAVGDFDNDGFQDLAVTDIVASKLNILFGNGDGTFNAAVAFNAGGGPDAVAVGDFNGDGNQDLAVVNFSGNVSILLNTTPTANASGGTTICPGGSTLLSGSGSGTIGPYTCSWSPATGLDDATSCTPNASPSVSTTYTLIVTDGNGCQSTNDPTVTIALYGSIAVAGNTEFCFDDLGGIASATAPPGGVTHFQWGYRVVSNTGSITDLAGHINSSYTLQGADFPSPGTYYLVCTLYITGTGCNTGPGTQTLVSNEIPITIDAACLGANPVPPPVQFFTLTTRNNSGTNVLQWFTANFTADATELRARTDGTYPLNEADGSLITTQSGAANTKVTYTHGGVANGTTYSYSLFEYKGILGPTLYSGDKNVSGRPFNAPAAVKWSFSSGGITLTSPGVRPTQSPTNGAIYSVSNNRDLDSMNLGPGGGDWPVSPSIWTPIAMNAPSQGRAIPVHLKVTSIGGSFNPVFVGATDGRVYAVNGLTGSLLWASPVLGDSITASPATMFNEVHGGAPDVVMVGANSSTGNKFYGLKIADGTIQWTFDHSGANDIGVISGQAYVDYTNNRTYFTSREGTASKTVWALNMSANPPTLVWSADAGDVDSGANLANSTLYIGNNTGQVYALNPATGAFKWTGPWSTGNGPVKNLVWTSGLKLYFSTTSQVNAINDNGTGTAPSAFWTSPVALPSPTDPIVNAGRAYVGAGDGRVYSIDATSATPATPTFTQLGNPSTPFQIGSPTLDNANHLLHVGSEPGQVYAVTVPF